MTLKKIIITTALIALSINAQAGDMLKGALVTSVEQIQVMAQSINANAYAITPETPEQITEYINAGQGMTAFIGVIEMLLGPDGFPSADKVQEIVNAINAADYDNVVIMIDEPLWRSMMLCINHNVVAHCNDIDSDFSQTLQGLQAIDAAIQAHTSAKSFHVEAYAVIKDRWARGKQMIMMDTSQHLGMDCYVGFDNCDGASIYDYNAAVYQTLWNMEQSNPIGRKLAVVPGSYTAPGITKWQSAQYMTQYKQMIDAPGIRDLIGMVGFFTWGGFNGMEGAEDHPMLQAIMSEKW